MEGALAALKGVEIKQEIGEQVVIDTAVELDEFTSEDEIIYIYCTEFIIKNPLRTAEEFLSRIHDKGDSIVCVGNENIIKTHLHTNNPGQILAIAVKFGELTDIKIDNMREQFRERQKENNKINKNNQKRKKYGFVSIGMGEGLKKVFTDLNVDVFLSGGQTMNPSTEDILEAANQINADHIIILPNNSNIILAATQAREISDKDIHVVPSKTIPQGITALIAFKEENSVEDNIKAMTQAAKEVKTGLVTYAIRDTVFNDLEIKKDQIIALYDGDIVNQGENPEDQAVELISKMVDEDSFLVTLFYGADVDKRTAEGIKSRVEEVAEDCDIEIIYGGQPLYYYIVSVE